MAENVTIHGYFRRAYLRSVRDRAFTHEIGPVVSGADGNRAGFKLQIEQGRIVEAAYLSTPCVTLMALCEHLSELVIGMPVERALSLDAEHLLRYHEEVPAERRDRALLAISALKKAIQSAIGSAD